jgi:preprotein translocase subunit SecG
MHWQSLLTSFLTVFLVLDCVFLVFLVLLQLPKKEAGAGLAFGGAATDALFGAGSGSNILTKITKYTAGGFFGLAILLAILGKPEKKTVNLLDQLTKPGVAAPATLPSASAAPSATATPSATTPTAAVPAPAPAEKPAEAASTNK